jgi:hypothetical protein
MSSDNSSLAKRINSNIESAAVIYSQNTAMRTAISLIPILCSKLSGCGCEKIHVTEKKNGGH